MTIKKLDLIAACDLNYGIGVDNKLPWHLPTDLRYFNDITSKRNDDGAAPKNVVIMGRKTWESFDPKYHPLPRRRNIVITRQKLETPLDAPNAKSFTADGKNRAVFVNSLNDAVEIAFSENDNSSCFIIGGSVIYEQALQHPAFDLLYLTRIDAKFECDSFFPKFEHLCSLVSESEVHQENGISYTFNVYQRKKA